MDELCRTFQKQGIANKVQLQRKLRNIKFSRSGKLKVTFYSNLKAVSKIRNCGETIDDFETITQLLASIPEHFQVVTNAIDVVICQEASNFTYNFVKNKLFGG